MTKAPANITFLTADGFGVLPPVARLTPEGGMFHFACGFTSKMPGTEKGIDEPVPTFSSFFGKPFMPLKPVYYMDLLGELVEAHGTEIWLVNTGWLGPNHAGRKRVDILVSKAIINAVRDGKIETTEENFWYDPIFKMHVPRHVPGVDPKILDPRNSWNDETEYLAAANKLASIFQGAIADLQGVPDSVLAAGPKPLKAAVLRTTQQMRRCFPCNVLTRGPLTVTLADSGQRLSHFLPHTLRVCTETS